MKLQSALLVILLSATSLSFAQATDAESIDRALAAAPRQMREAATVIKWKADNTYETIKKGTNKLFCYDRSGEPGRQPFAVQCTVMANLDRVTQNRKFEAIADKAKRQAEMDAAEAAGTRVKPEYGSVWYAMSGADKDKARLHVTIAMPGATSASTGFPDTPAKGGAWLMNAGTSTAHLMTPGS